MGVQGTLCAEPRLMIFFTMLVLLLPCRARCNPWDQGCPRVNRGSMHHTSKHKGKSEIPKYDVRHCAPCIRRVQARGPKNWVWGPFDKAPTCLWGACRILLCSLYDKAFFKAPHRYTVLHKYISPQEAHLALFSEIVQSAEVAFSESQVQGTSPHY